MVKDEKILQLIDELIIYLHYPEDSLLQDSGLSDKQITEIQAEYIRLFVNDFDGKIISLCVSAYIKDLAAPEIISYLKNLYNTAGIKINPEFKEREDHILFCLEFLYLLIYNNIEKKLIENFSRNFVLPFIEVPELIRAKTSSEYFITAANLLEELFAMLEDWLLLRAYS